MGTTVEMRPILISKANTAVQIILAALVLADLALIAELATLRQPMIWLAAFLTLASGFAYVAGWTRLMSAPTTTPDRAGGKHR
jgi:cardiolipin synthase